MKYRILLRIYIQNIGINERYTIKSHKVLWKLRFFRCNLLAFFLSHIQPACVHTPENTETELFSCHGDK